MPNMGGTPLSAARAGLVLGKPHTPSITQKKGCQKNWEKFYYISPMKLERLLKVIYENEPLKTDLCSMAAMIIVAFVILGIMNLFTF